MDRRKRAVLLGVSAVLLLSPCKADESVEELPRPPAPPEIFGPLSWETTSEDLARLFPSASMFDAEYEDSDGEKKVLHVISKIRWAHFGAAVVHVDRGSDGNVDMLGISTTETRPECYEDLPPPKGCRNGYSRELLAVMEKVRQPLSKTYGPAQEFKGQGAREADGLPPDARENTYQWRRPGFDLFLAITVGEDDYWAVELKARRRP